MEHSNRPIQRIAESKSAGSGKTAIPHLLPCRINHSGRVPGAGDHWKVQKGEGIYNLIADKESRCLTNHSTDGQRTAHFRGRRLLGSTVTLPAGYSGVVMSKPETSSTERPVSGSVFAAIEAADGMGEDDLPGPPETELVVAAEFDELVVWGHDVRPDGSSDPYIRGAVEWMQLAEKVSRALIFMFIFKCL